MFVLKTNAAYISCEKNAFMLVFLSCKILILEIKMRLFVCRNLLIPPKHRAFSK